MGNSIINKELFYYREIHKCKLNDDYHAFLDLCYELKLEKVGYDLRYNTSVWRSTRKLKHPELIVLDLVETTINFVMLT